MYELSYDEAQKRSDIKQFFGEKYGSKVRVVDIAFSKELCGGTHTSNVGTIGFFKIVKESSIAAGVRRIEAVCGKYAEAFVQGEEDLLQRLAGSCKTSVALLGEKVSALLEENKTLQQEIKLHRKGELEKLLASCLDMKKEIDGGLLIAEEVSLQTDEIIPFAEALLGHLKSGVVVLGASNGDKCQLVIAVSSNLVEKNIHAQILIKEVSSLIQGGGGGKPNLAQAGGKDPTGIPKAIEKMRQRFSC